MAIRHALYKNGDVRICIIKMLLKWYFYCTVCYAIKYQRPQFKRSRIEGCSIGLFSDTQQHEPNLASSINVLNIRND